MYRTVIGQVIVGKGLIERIYSPAEVIMVAICGEGNPDLEWFCDQNNIQVAYFSVPASRYPPKRYPSKNFPKDIRKPPDAKRLRAFLSGWTAAVNGKPYRSIFRKKTHANMGNLFGLIYGDQPMEFRKSTWERYVKFGQGSKNE